jgi:hypothetical protein
MVHPTNDWKFDDDAEIKFVEWFNDLSGGFAFRSEYFYGDCKVGDEKTREDIMHGWIHSAFVAGWEAANYAKLEEEVGLTDNE